MENQFDLSHILGHAFSLGAIFGAFSGWLPAVAAIVALTWYIIQIWESRTVQHWYNNKRMLYRARKVARLKAKQKVILAKLEAMDLLRAARVTAREKVAMAASEAEQQRLQEETERQTKESL